jgi:hypothetical protein
LQDPPKFTQIEIFGLKMCHLATLPARSYVAATSGPGKVEMVFRIEFYDEKMHARHFPCSAFVACLAVPSATV